MFVYELIGCGFESSCSHLNMPRNPPFCSFASFLIVSLTTFIDKPESVRNLIIFMIFTSLSKIVVVPESKFSFKQLHLLLTLLSLILTKWH